MSAAPATGPTVPAPPRDAGAGTATPVTANAAPPLGPTEIPMQGGKGKTLAIALAIAAAVVIGIVALRMAQSKGPPASAAALQSSAMPPEVAPIAPAPFPPAKAAEPAPDTPTASAAAAPGAPSATAAATAVNAGKKAPPPAARAPTPAKPKTSCDPNYYLDAQGEKHFKPECFR
jgi:hypothetical protein